MEMFLATYFYGCFTDIESAFNDMAICLPSGTFFEMILGKQTQLYSHFFYVLKQGNSGNSVLHPKYP